MARRNTKLTLLRLLVGLLWWGTSLGLPLSLFAWSLGLGGFSWSLPVHVQLLGAGATPAGLSAELSNLSADLTIQSLADVPSPLLALGLVAFGLVLVVLWNLRAIVRSLGEEPFEARNPTRLRRIAGAVVLLGILGPLGPIAGAPLVQRVAVPGVSVYAGLDVDLSFVFFAALLLVLAEVFAHGHALEEESSLTV